MCGIFGVSDVPEAARLTYLGLYALQHRGQESAGIVAVDRDGLARAHRGMGLVSRPSPNPHEQAAGRRGGGSHPLLAPPAARCWPTRSPALPIRGWAALGRPQRQPDQRGPSSAANWWSEGAIFTSHRHRGAGAPHRPLQRGHGRRADSRSAGARRGRVHAWSCRVGGELYAVVDPRGFRPLVMGRLTVASLVASETCALDLVGRAAASASCSRASSSAIEDGQVTEPRPAARPRR